MCFLDSAWYEVHIKKSHRLFEKRVLPAKAKRLRVMSMRAAKAFFKI
jgi:hypothetical protein